MGVPNLAKIAPIVSRLIPPEDSKVIGQTPWGDTLYERTIDRGKNVPVLDAEGNPVHELHPTTAMPLYPKRKLVKNPETYQFYLYDAGNGNVREERYQPPTEEDLRASKRAEMVAAAQRKIAEALVDNDLSVESLVDALKPKPTPKARS